MSAPKLLNYTPDADFIITRDYSKNQRLIHFQLETRFQVPEEHVGEVEALLQAVSSEGTRAAKEAAYGFLYGLAQSDLDKDGPAHAMLQAAFGIIHLDSVAAAKMKRAPEVQGAGV